MPIETPWDEVRESLSKTARSPVVPFFLFFITLLDLYVFVFPADAFLAAALVGHPKGALKFCVAVIVARLVGVVGFYYAGAYVPMEQIQQWVQALGVSDGFEKSRVFLEKHGPLALTFVSMTPIPMQFLVFFAAAAGAPLLKLELYLLPGLVVKSFVIWAMIGSGLYFVGKNRPKGTS